MYLGNWTEKLARACARRPWVTIGIWVVILVLAVLANITWLGDALVTEVEPTNNPESSEAEDIKEERLGISIYDTLDTTVIIRSSTLTVDDAEFRSHVEELFGEFMTLGEDIILSGVTYYMTESPMMVSIDRHSAIISLTMPWEADEEVNRIYEIGDSYATDSFEIFYTGSAPFMVDMMELGESSTLRGETIGLSAAIVILTIVFGAIAAAILPIILGMVSIAVALGLVALVGQSMDLTFMITNMVTMMGLAVGIDYSLFVLTRFREERQRGREKWMPSALPEPRPVVRYSSAVLP